MASKLQTNLEEILNEKQTKIIPENLKAGVEAFGVAGNFTSDADATAADIAKDKTAYVNGEKVTGVMEVSDYNTTLDIEDRTTFTLVNALKEINFSNIDTSKITLFSDAFADCKYLEKIIGAIDCSSATNITRMFSNCSMLTEVSIINTSNVTNMTVTFNNCSSLTKIPEIDTSKVTTFSKTFYGCTSLVTVPVLNMSSITATTNVWNMFHNCKNLSDESLNNIMESCITAKVTSSLSYMGLSVDTTRCQSLSNYEAFIASGWTI